jgi:hypothetical protein
VPRDHEVFRSPRPIDVTKTTSLDTPDAWKGAITAPRVEAMPLVRDVQEKHHPGWCTYTYEAEDAPEMEVICGGINHKTPRAGAIWRQGHLLHFGFDLSPARMNAVGQRLLVNAVAYVARFTEDRPVVHTPCIFVQGRGLFDRGAVGRLLARPGADLGNLKYYVAKETYDKELAGKSREQVAAWYRRARDYLDADAEGTLTVDEEARSFGVPPGGPAFIERAADALDDPGRSREARRLLARYAPEGPGATATAAEWRAWWKKDHDYLFFSDVGGYRWYLDPLAKQRGVPTARLRGPARATLPPPRPGGR